MADLNCSPEVQGIAAFLKSTGVAAVATSTLRPGAVTAAGYPSRHGMGLAVDWDAPVARDDSAELAAIFNAFLPVERHLAELIYAGPQVSFNIKHGKRVGKYAQAQHHDHVHVAVDKGTILANIAPSPVDEVGEIAPAPPNHQEDQEEMTEPMDALCAPGGGTWVLTKDGGVRAYKNAPFYGSYPALRPENRQGERTFVRIEPYEDGYVLYSAGDEQYHFNSGVWAQIQRGEI
jgi:hypothetical protein